MNPIKHYLIEHLSDRVNRKSKIPHINTSFKEARDFGLLFTWEGEVKYAQVREVIKFLEIHNKNAELLCYVKSLKENIAPELPVYYDKDISLWGKAKSRILDAFINKTYDFLWHLDMNQNIMARYVLSRTHARCRVGKTEPDSQQYYEMMISSAGPDDFKDLCEQILHYTKAITTYA